jgi:alkylated DNA repair dioxygenase AlkB
LAIQQNLFDLAPSGLPDGFCRRADFLDAEEERALVSAIAPLPFEAFQFHGFEGRRRVVSFGWQYDFSEAKLKQAAPIPADLDAVREKAARFAGLEARALEQCLVIEYPPGAAIGWHKDRPVFGEVIGVSLGAPATFRFRRKEGAKWARASLRLGPRSVYVLRGASRWDWEHSIPAVDALRYSLTFRTLRVGARLDDGGHPAISRSRRS